MNNNYYSLFIQKVQQLAETIVIKSDVTAETLNKLVTDYHGTDMVDALRPETWKYYLNLSGEYHSTDSLMSVVSMDTLEEILFSKQNLQVHRATARGYAYGTRAYQALVAQYPQQEMLILGILYPVDINAAIAAKDGAILGYPPGLVESNEYSLISNLQKWIDGFKTRWINQQFGISDELYPATSLGIMYLQLVPAIITLRLQACKTNEAHSFHVRQYLASHGFLDAFVDSMTLKQALWFYRNIAYIERNVGKQSIFDLLVEHIMTERALPLAEFTMRHDVSAQPDELYPTPVFRRTPINLEYNQVKDVISLDLLLDKEVAQARDNQQYRPDYQPVIEQQMENSLSNVVMTKLLESSVIDTSDSAPHTLEEVLLAEWLDLSTKGYYVAYTSVTNPKSGERIPLIAKDAYTFVWYAFCRTIGVELVTVPTVTAVHAQRLPTPSVQELLSVVDSSLVSADIAQQAVSMQPVVGQLISTDAFYNLCLQIYNAGQMQRNLVAYQEHMMRRGMVANMCELIYSDNVCQLEADGTTYAAWFALHGIKIDEFTLSDLSVMWPAMMREATGLDLHPTSSLKAMQAAMIGMFTRLSSYSIQLVSDINSSNVKKTDWTATRVGDALGSTSDIEKFPDAVVGVQNANAGSGASVEVEINSAYAQNILSSTSAQQARLEIASEVEHHSTQINRPGHMQVATVRPSADVPAAPPGEMSIPVYGMDATFWPLTEQQRQMLRDMFTTTPYGTVPDVSTNIADQLSNTVLDGLTITALTVTPTVLFDGVFRTSGQMDFTTLVGETFVGAAGISYVDAQGTHVGNTYRASVTAGDPFQILVNDPTQVTALAFEGQPILSNSAAIAPDYFDKLSALRSLKITGGFPPGTTVPALTAAAALQTVQLQAGFGGALPSVAGLTQLTSLNLADNSFTGAVPNFASNTALTDVNLRNNSLTGWTVGSNSTLLSLQLQGNPITAAIPDLTQYPQLQTLIFTGDSGSVPAWNSPNVPASLSDLEIEQNMPASVVDAALAAMRTSSRVLQAGDQIILAGSNQPPTTLVNKQALQAAGWTVVVSAPLVIAPANTVAPALQGNTEAGTTLACDTGTWINGVDSFVYQWYANGVAIAGQTTNQYVTQPEDVTKSITCLVTASNTAGYASVASNALVVSTTQCLVNASLGNDYWVPTFDDQHPPGVLFSTDTPPVIDLSPVDYVTADVAHNSGRWYFEFQLNKVYYDATGVTDRFSAHAVTDLTAERMWLLGGVISCNDLSAQLANPRQLNGYQFSPGSNTYVTHYLDGDTGSTDLPGGAFINSTSARLGMTVDMTTGDWAFYQMDGSVWASGNHAGLVGLKALAMVQSITATTYFYHRQMLYLHQDQFAIQGGIPAGALAWGSAENPTPNGSVNLNFSQSSGNGGTNLTFL